MLKLFQIIQFSKNPALNVAKHAEYSARQKFIQAPFGKAFKTGKHQTSKNDVSRKSAKQQLKRDFILHDSRRANVFLNF